jgi:hypothetical protein
MPVTFSEDGAIQSLTIYHNGGSGHVLMGVYYDASGTPSTRLGVTPSTVINAAEGWQTVSLSTPVSVTSGQTVWLSWVFENIVGTRYTAGTPARAQSTDSWAAGMPSPFGTAALGNYKYSLYCTYTPGGAKSAGGSVGSKSAGGPDESESLNNLYDINSTDLKDGKVVIYPNPTDGNVTIRLNNYYDSRLILTIYDLQGRPVKTVQVEPENTEIQVNLDDVEHGFYLFVLKDRNGLIINRSRILKL